MDDSRRRKIIMTAKRTYTFTDGKSLTLGERTLVMGILNVTPDSFSDGGKWNTRDKMLYHMEQMVKDGADIIDIGAESSRPGFTVMSADEEIERLLPFLDALIPECPVPVSVDTFKAQTARVAAEHGVHMLNDIWGMQYEKEPGKMAAVAAETGLPIVVMHNQDRKEYAGDIIDSMRDFFRRSIALADAAGMKRENIILDPGIGFGKTPEGNVEVLRRQQELLTIDGEEYPLLLGTSRKSFIGAALDLPVEERMEATGATCVIGIMKGAGIVRVHDVKPIARMCRMTDVILGKGEE
jgi:dihydropteroate synthase